MLKLQWISFRSCSSRSGITSIRIAVSSCFLAVGCVVLPFFNICRGQEVKQTSQTRTPKDGDAKQNQPIASRILDRIPAGTSVHDEKNRGFTNLILFVKGRLEAGDVEAVSDTTKYYADLFNLVYMANVTKDSEGFALDKVAVGFSTGIGQNDIVVTSETAKAIGLSLSFIGKGVLSGNEAALNDIKVTAKDRFMAIIDAPSVMQFEGKHQTMIARFFIWVTPTDGRVGTVVWLLQNKNKQYTFADNEINYLPPSMVEDRVMHVDGSKFTLGIPSSKAFAMMSLPKGRAYKIDDTMQDIGSQSSYTPAMLKELSRSLAKIMSQ